MIKDITRCLILLWLSALPSGSIYSQSVFTDADRIEIRERGINKIKELQLYMCDIVNYKLSDHARQNSIKSALALFVGKGDAFYVENEYGNRELRNPTRVILFEENSRKCRRIRIKQFLNNLYNNPHRYGVIQLQSVDIEVVDSVIYDSMKAFMHQERYAISSDSTMPYQTKISSRYVRNINPIKTPVGTVWDAKLGDVYVTATRLD